MKAEIADVQDTGERFKCHCYHYLIKYKSIEDGKVWIEPVEIRDGAVYVPTANRLLRRPQALASPL
ncbi:MAG: hypothetical protein IPK04_14915 [Bdellovibrionales bacterium]|nr:hypothetical protein [Bdellovibrionales bacterium]